MRTRGTEAARTREVREMLSATRQLIIEQAEDEDRGDLEAELEGELWRLEQGLFDPRKRSLYAAASSSS